MKKLEKAPRMNRRSEYPPWIYWSLFIGLWSLLVIMLITLYTQRDHLEIWKLSIYAFLLGVYLFAERKAYHAPPSTGQRAHEPLRYLLSLTWWCLMLGCPLVYALWPLENIPLTLLGIMLMIAGSGLRVWAVYTLGAYYSGHIETWEDQTVVQSGPYRVLRNPGYAGNLLQALGLPLILNAYPALLLTLAVMVLFVARLLWEERWLSLHLPGYREYCSHTFRLIPGVW